MKALSGILAGTVILAFSIQASAGQPLEDSGKALLKKNQKAVIAVKLAVKESISFEGQSTRKQDSIIDVTGTCLDENGLIVVSLRTIDKSEMLGSLNLNFEDETIKSKFESEITDVKLIIPGSPEIPGKVVLRDKDLDLAFFRPLNKTDTKFEHVDMVKSAKLEILEQFFIIDRLGKEEGRVPVILASRVGAVLEKPRTFYVSGDLITSMTLGSPAFSIDGKFIGIVVYRVQPGTGRARNGVDSMGSQSGPMPGVIPVSEILDVLKQLPAEKIEK